MVVVLVWGLLLGGEGWFWLVSPEGGGWRRAMLGGIPGGGAMHCSLSVGQIQVSTMTHPRFLLHA